MIFIGVNGDNTLGIVDNNSRTEGKCLILDLVKALGIALVFQSYRRHIISRRRSIGNIGGIAHKVNRLFVLARVPVNDFIGNGNKVREIKPYQSVFDHILDTVKLLCIEYFIVKFVGDLEVHKISRYLNGQLIVCQRSKRKPDIVQIGEISAVTVFRFTEIVDKPLCLIKRSFKDTLEVHDLHRLVRIMFEHCRLQELRKSGQLSIRLDLHFIATVIDTANRLSAVEKLSDLITVSNRQFPCAALCFSRFAVRAEERINDLLQSLEFLKLTLRRIQLKCLFDQDGISCITELFRILVLDMIGKTDHRLTVF